MKGTALATCALLFLAACFARTEVHINADNGVIVATAWASTRDRAVASAEDAAQKTCREYQTRTSTLQSAESFLGLFKAAQVIETWWFRRHQAKYEATCPDLT